MVPNSSRQAGPVLTGLNVLITRPADRAGQLIAMLEADGARVRHVPLLAIAPLGRGDEAIIRATRARVLELDRYQRAIAVSVTAVKYGFEWIRQYWPQLPAGLRWYGIGAATAAALGAEDVVAVTPGGSMTTEAMLALPEFADLTGERVLILRGVGGRRALMEALHSRGAEVDIAECYRRLPPPDSAALRQLDDWRPDAICVNSGETLANLCACLPPPVASGYLSLPLIVPSERVADDARTRGFAQVITAENAGDDATVATLQRLVATIDH